jgi:hypothetical protein
MGDHFIFASKGKRKEFMRQFFFFFIFHYQMIYIYIYIWLDNDDINKRDDLVDILFS